MSDLVNQWIFLKIVSLVFGMLVFAFGMHYIIRPIIERRGNNETN